MSHVDEGALHAYLDGALDEFPAAEAAEIRTHLATCGACAARLEQERAVRAEAHAVLGLATPDIEMPTLEDLRAYVQRTRTPARAAGTRMARMGWAASIVFAAGAGWMLRDGQLQTERLGPQRDAAEAVAVEARARPDMAADERLSSGRTDVEALEESVAAAPPPATSSTESAEALAGALAGRQFDFSDIDAEAGRAADAGAAQVAMSNDPAASAPSMNTAAADDAGRADRAGGRIMAAERADVLLTVPSAPAAMAARSRSEEASPQLDAFSTTVVPLEARAANVAGEAAEEEASEKAEPRRTESPRPVTSAIDQGRLSRTMAAVDEDRRIDEEPALAVPGYDVVSVTNLGEGTTAIGAHVRQRFDGATIFEIFHLEPGVDPAVVPPSAGGDREVRVESEAGWVVVRGPLDDDTLGVLLALLFPG